MICDLPPRAVELLLVIVTNHHQREPITYASLMERTGFARSVVYRHLANLEAAGFVRRTPPEPSRKTLPEPRVLTEPERIAREIGA